MPDRRVTDDMVTRALEVLQGGPPDEDLVRRALEDALLAPGAAAVVTEYATRELGGDYQIWHTWNTEPWAEKLNPVADRIRERRRDHVNVYERSIIVVDDWTEVSEP